MSDVIESVEAQGLDCGWVECPTGTAMPIRTRGPDKSAKGVSIRAPGATDAIPNTATIYIGTRADLTADRSGASVALPPGASITLCVNDPSLLYCISTEANQWLNWVSL